MPKNNPNGMKVSPMQKSRHFRTPETMIKSHLSFPEFPKGPPFRHLSRNGNLKRKLCRFGALLMLPALLYTVQVHAQANKTNAETVRGSPFRHLSRNGDLRYTVESIDFDFGEDKPAYKPKKLLEKLGFETGDDVIWAETGRDNLEAFYHEKGFAFAQVALRSEQLADGKMKLTYEIDEGPRIKIGKVSLLGNVIMPDDKLKKALKTAKKDWFLWPLDYVEEQVNEDLEKLKSIYWRAGFLAHRITYSLDPNLLDPAIMARECKTDKCKVDITFAIDKGPFYIVEKILLKFIDAEGQILEEIVLKSVEPEDEQRRTEYETFDEKQLRAQVYLEPAQVYNERIAEWDAEKLRKLYREKGFINTKVRLLSPVFIPDANAVNVEYEIFEGRQYRIGRIDITGNKETQDKVIRRILDEYEFFPGQLYNADLAPIEGGGELEQTIKRMTLAEAISITPIGEGYGPDDANVLGQNVEVNIKEGLTGQIWPGVGLSSDHGLFGQLVYDERNFDINDWPESLSELIPGRSFRGAGQNFRISAEPGVELSQYSVSFSEPYFRNKPLTLDVIGQIWERDNYDDEYGFGEKRTEGNIGFTKRLKQGRQQSISFRLENINVRDFSSAPPRELTEVEGDNLIAGVKFGLGQYNFNTSYEQVTGDHTFGILSATQEWHRVYKDLLEGKTTLSARLRASTVIGDAPPFEKFYAGGTGRYGIRGFDYRGVSTRAGINKDQIGSDWIILANAEATVPLTDEVLSALFFYDSGIIDSGGYRASLGTGLQIMIPQWFGPVPMRLELGVPILRDDDDERRIFSFSIGRLF